MPAPTWKERLAFAGWSSAALLLSVVSAVALIAPVALAAWALVRWLRWAFHAWKNGGLWRGKVRVSARSKDQRVDVSAVCAQFGGGGHRSVANDPGLYDQYLTNTALMRLGRT